MSASQTPTPTSTSLPPYSPHKLTLDHLGVKVPATLFEAELTFYNAALAALGLKEQFRIMPLVAAIGDNPQKQEFWVSGVDRSGPVEGPVSSVHFAFRAKDRAQVDGFHSAGVAAGGKDNGAPGIREMYHAGYYAAFVVSPAGHTVEAVFHDLQVMDQK